MSGLRAESVFPRWLKILKGENRSWDSQHRRPCPRISSAGGHENRNQRFCTLPQNDLKRLALFFAGVLSDDRAAFRAKKYDSPIGSCLHVGSGIRMERVTFARRVRDKSWRPDIRHIGRNDAMAVSPAKFTPRNCR
jgi:hypothetical protein